MATDLLGRVFGRLTVTEDLGKRYFHCLCTCGTQVPVRRDHLLTGKIKSCKCLMRESGRARRHGHTINGKVTTEYRCWCDIIQRCHNPKRGDYLRYGGRGIQVCVEWRNSFEAFIQHIGTKPSPAHSIERIRNERGYEPGNVYWATAIAQQRNKRSSHKLTIDGITQCIAAWSEQSGIKAVTIERRLRVQKLTATEAVFLPVRYQTYACPTR